MPDPEGPFGAKGLGEHVLIPTAPAILNAIRHATGALVTRLPATPSRVLAAIRAQGAACMSEVAERFEPQEAGAKQVGDKIRCDACPVMCYIADGRTGACDRYGNVGGRIVRLDPLTILDARREGAGAFRAEADGMALSTARSSSGIGAGTTYPDYKPAPFIVSAGSRAASTS